MELFSKFAKCELSIHEEKIWTIGIHVQIEGAHTGGDQIAVARSECLGQQPLDPKESARDKF